MKADSYPCAELFSKKIGIPVENLICGFEIEKEFHNKILCEQDEEVRKKMYAEVYARVHPLYRVNRNIQAEIASKYPTVNLFRRELEGKSILDIGCGTGDFLLCIAQYLKHKCLVGIDTNLGIMPDANKVATFIEKDIPKSCNRF